MVIQIELNQFWEFFTGALSLNPEVFQQIQEASSGNVIAFLMVLVAGLSQSIGQCIVLFINRVTRIRFILSLGIAAILFAVTYLFWALSTWCVADFIFHLSASFEMVARTLGLSYAPEILSFLIPLPYWGVPISVLLSLWTLLAIITGMDVITGLGTWEALACTGLGWIVLQLLQRTVGKPVTQVGRWLLNQAAGRELVLDRAGLDNLIETGAPSMPNWQETSELIQSSAQTKLKTIHPGVRFTVLAVITCLMITLFALEPWQFLSLWYAALGQTLKLTLNLVIISVLALGVSILMTPLEALTWWAGWYIPENLNTGTPVKIVAPETEINRYVIFLDGINQGSYQYLPEVERFLNHLAEATPPNVMIVKGIMPYSVSNRSLTEDRPLAMLWHILDSLMHKHPTNPVGMIINLRNVFAVTVSADPRYGVIQNQGLAQVLVHSLLSHGYDLNRHTPVTLIGYSGGGQMSMGAVSFLKKTLQAPIEVISLAGVISGNTGALIAEHLYHLVGEQDSVEKLGPVMFPGRWPIAFLSNWNRAKRRGKITVISLGPVGHNGDNGPMGDGLLPDGRTCLEQTVELITGILLKDWTVTGLNPAELRIVSNYERYQAALFNQLHYYPISQTLDPEYYQPLGSWMGRLILPQLEERATVQGVWLEVYHADTEHQHLVGKRVKLQWQQTPAVRNYIEPVTQDLQFVEHVGISQNQGNIHPERLEGWKQVNPLESLAGAHPDDDVMVKLPEYLDIQVSDAGEITLQIERAPIVITGQFYGLVTFIQFVGGDLFQVRHYNRNTQKFDGLEEIVYVPSVIADRNNVFPSINSDLEQSPLNVEGWYIYGAQNRDGQFVVQSIAPRALFSPIPRQKVTGEKATLDYINHEYWRDAPSYKGQIKTVFLDPRDPEVPGAGVPGTTEGDMALVMHVYGGIGGKKAEFAPLNIYFGHFAFGISRTLREPLTNELRFDIEYRQIYTHNPDGIIAGTHAWNHYTGDRQYGWLGTRPICDIIIQYPPLTQNYNFNDIQFSPLEDVIHELDVMAARYRIGDGTGTTFVSPVNSCVQDSCQALYNALQRIIAQIELNPSIIKWLREHPDHEQTQRFFQLTALVETLESHLTPLGIVRRDWQFDTPTLGRFPQETPLKTVFKTLASWRSILPRLANDHLAMIFLQLGATLWLLQSYQVAGEPDIEPIAPTDMGFRVPKVKKVDLNL